MILFIQIRSFSCHFFAKSNGLLEYGGKYLSLSLFLSHIHILIKEQQSSGEVSNTLRSSKRKQAIFYGDILYTYILLFKPKNIFFFNYSFSYNHFWFQCCKSYLLQAACQTEVDNYSLYQYILCQTVMSHPQRASHPK